MEIKQLEYFAAAVEYGSLNRAAEKLYTTQPNVSRVLNSLEKELHVTLLERSNKGIKMTPQGEELYGHAMSILKHSNVIRSMSERPNGRRFSVSGYRSGLLTKLMVQLYQGGREQIKYEYREGTVEMVNVKPQLKAGGSFSTAAWNEFEHPCAVEYIQAHAGIDIGDTLIGMHLRHVAVPVRTTIKSIGSAHVVCARTRLKYIGGERAAYQK